MQFHSSYVIVRICQDFKKLFRKEIFYKLENNDKCCIVVDEYEMNIFM